MDNAVLDGIGIELLALFNRSVVELNECAFICPLGGEEGRTGRIFKGCRGCLLGELCGVDPRRELLNDDVGASRSVFIMCGFQRQYPQEIKRI